MLDLRIANPDVSANILGEYAAKQISKTGSFKHFIDSYTEYIITTGKQARKQIVKNKKQNK